MSCNNAVNTKAMINKETRDEVLYDYLSGNLSEEQMDEVERWMAAEECNNEYFKGFRKQMLELRWGMRAELVKGTMGQLEGRLRRRLVRRAVAWAAAVVCVLGAGLAVVVHKPVDEVRLEVAGIEPGRSRAVLILSSGETVGLDGEGRRLTEANGTMIEVDSAGGVNYTGRDAAVTELLYNTIVTPRGGEYSVVLSDGTRVWLNAETELRYPVTFGQGRRTVELKGEAYFQVAKDAVAPFLVMAGSAEVRVYGTGFNVNCYRGDRVETVLVEGSVGMSQGGSEVKLKPGQMGSTSPAGNGITVEDVDVHAYVAWKDGYFAFENESLEDIMETLVRWYDIKVFYARDDAREERLYGHMKRYRDIRSLLHYFEQISDLRFEVKGNTVTVR